MSTTIATAQGEFLRERLEEVDRINRKSRQLTEGLSAAKLRQTPPHGGWSIDEVFEHLVISSSDYLGRMQQLIEPARAKDEGRSWRPSLFGKLLVRSLRGGRPGRMKSPRAWRPLAARVNVIEAFLAGQDQLSSLLRRAAGFDMNRLRTHSPVSRLIRLNLGDCFLILNVHAERHLAQIQRTRDEITKQSANSSVDPEHPAGTFPTS